MAARLLCLMMVLGCFTVTESFAETAATSPARQAWKKKSAASTSNTTTTQPTATSPAAAATTPTNSTSGLENQSVETRHQMMMQKGAVRVAPGAIDNK